jgi:hypothetical protein
MIEAMLQGVGFAIGAFLAIILLMMAGAGIGKQGYKGDKENGVDTRGQGRTNTGDGGEN